MFIAQYTWQHRYDFTAIIECPHCGHQQTLEHGYDDHNYHYNVLPKIGCSHCGKDESGVIGDYITFGYPKAKLIHDSSDTHHAIEEAAKLADDMYYLGPDFAKLAQQIRDLKMKY